MVGVCLIDQSPYYFPELGVDLGVIRAQKVRDDTINIGT